MAAPLVGFSGSRRLSAAFAPVVAAVVSAVAASGRGVAVGDARGADAFVRAACPTALIFRVSGVGPAAFARRSIALVSAASALCVFPGSPCPPGLVPSASSSACFAGFGSGSWSSAAFAVGRGLPVVVFSCGFSAAQLPAWGGWAVAGSGVWSAGFRLVESAQRSLF